MDSEQEKSLSHTDDISGRRILVVDDHVGNMKLLTRILEREGYSSVETAADARSVPAVVARFRPDLVLLDLRMPHVRGFSLLEEVRGLLPPGAPIVLLTGEVDETTRSEALSRGAVDVLVKPYEVRVVARCVDMYLRAYAAGSP